MTQTTETPAEGYIPMTKTTRKKIIKGWIGDKSWMPQPLAHTTEEGKQFGSLFETKKDALMAGWKKPVRVEISVRIL